MANLKLESSATDGKYVELGMEQEAHLLNGEDEAHQVKFIVHSIAKCSHCQNFTACKDVTYVESGRDANSTPHLLCQRCWETIPCEKCQFTAAQLVLAKNQYLCYACNEIRLHPPAAPAAPTTSVSVAVSSTTPAISIPNPKRGSFSSKTPVGTPPDASSLVSPMVRGIVSTPMYTPPTSSNLGPVMPRTQRITSLNHHEWVRAQEATNNNFNKPQTPSPSMSPAPVLSSTPPLTSPVGSASAASSTSNNSNNNNSVGVAPGGSSSSVSLTGAPVIQSGGPVKAILIPSNNNPSNNPPKQRISPLSSLKVKKDGDVNPEARKLSAVKSVSRIKPDDDDGEDDYLNISSKISLDGKLDYGRQSLDNSVSEQRGDHSRSELQIVEIDDVLEHDNNAPLYPEPAN